LIFKTIFFPSPRKSGGKEISYGRQLVPVRADVRGMCRLCHRPRAPGTTTCPQARHYAALSQKQLQHHVYVGSGPIPAQDVQKSSFIHRHKRQHPQKTRMYSRRFDLNHLSIILIAHTNLIPTLMIIDLMFFSTLS